MAKTQAAFLSMGTTGSIGGVLVAAKWKGITTIRQKVSGTDPRTPAQLAHRQYMAAVSKFFSGDTMTTRLKESWELAAKNRPRKISARQFFMQSMLGLSLTEKNEGIACDASFTTNMGQLSYVEVLRKTPQFPFAIFGL